MSAEFLSPAGRQRKAAIGVALRGAVVRRRRQRLALRGAVVLLLGLAAVFAWPRDDAPPASPQMVDNQESKGRVEKPKRFKHFDFEVVEAKPSARVASWVVRDRSVTEFLVDDESLSGLLRDSGRDAGFMRVGAEVALLVPLRSDD